MSTFSSTFIDWWTTWRRISLYKNSILASSLISALLFLRAIVSFWILIYSICAANLASSLLLSSCVMLFLWAFATLLLELFRRSVISITPAIYSAAEVIVFQWISFTIFEPKSVSQRLLSWPNWIISDIVFLLRYFRTLLLACRAIYLFSTSTRS